MVHLIVLDEPHLMKLSGVGVVIPTGCYSSGENLLELSGSTVTISDCTRACVVSFFSRGQFSRSG